MSSDCVLFKIQTSHQQQNSSFVALVCSNIQKQSQYETEQSFLIFDKLSVVESKIPNLHQIKIFKTNMLAHCSSFISLFRNECRFL